MKATTVGPQAVVTVQQSNVVPFFLPRIEAQNQRPQNRPRYEKIDPIPVTYSELYPQLLRMKQISPAPYRQPLPPYPKWYNPKVKCGYHGGAVGHLIDNCPAFKYKVQQLVRSGWLKFEEKDHPEMNENSLPSHVTQSIKAIKLNNGSYGRTELNNNRMPSTNILQVPLDNGYLKKDLEGQSLGHIENCCRYHGNRSGHALENSKNFRSKLQNLVDSSLISFCSGNDKDSNRYMTAVESDESQPPTDDGSPVNKNIRIGIQDRNVNATYLDEDEGQNGEYLLQPGEDPNNWTAAESLEPLGKK